MPQRRGRHRRNSRRVQGHRPGHAQPVGFGRNRRGIETGRLRERVKRVCRFSFLRRQTFFTVMNDKTRKQRFREIENAVSKGFQSIVIELCEDYIKRYPHHWAVQYYYARALTDASQYKKAKHWYLRLIKSLEKSEPQLLDTAYSGLGKLYKRMGNYKKASEWYKKASEIDPDEASYLIFLGVSQYRLGKFDEAEKILKQAIGFKK